MLEIAICDDQASQLSMHQKLLEEWIGSTSRTANIRCFTSGEELLASVQGGISYTLYLLDILLPGMNGIELGRRLRLVGESGAIIYITGTRDYAVESYDVHAIHYLLKPVVPSRLFSVLNYAFLFIETEPSKSIQIKTREGIVRLSMDDILYAELSRRSVHYITETEIVKSTSIREPFSQAVSPLLEDARFALAGASFAINLSCVQSVSRSSVTLRNGTQVILPASACPGLRAAWIDYGQRH